MEFNINTGQVDSSASFNVSTDTLSNSISGFISKKESYRNGIEGFFISVYQRDINLYVVDENNNPIVADVVFSADGFDDLADTTDQLGFLSVDYAPKGRYIVSKDGYQDQEHFYDSDLWNGGYQQITLRTCVFCVVGRHGVIFNAMPYSPQSNLFI